MKNVISLFLYAILGFSIVVALNLVISFCKHDFSFCFLMANEITQEGIIEESGAEIDFIKYGIDDEIDFNAASFTTNSDSTSYSNIMLTSKIDENSIRNIVFEETRYVYFEFDITNMQCSNSLNSNDYICWNICAFDLGSGSLLPVAFEDCTDHYETFIILDECFNYSNLAIVFCGCPVDDTDLNIEDVINEQVKSHDSTIAIVTLGDYL